ncbi:hypothetical protein Lmor_3100 [Legionella moravica]|uniref:Uncharacterized protein n=1 Tax=Legionella moravica TaxID=39962 RepID=A0A378JZX6_9GAMM|nr:hypothetical protein [Legionella moravica]KTD30993.1 hypothetical protein Lmor_3100 [Legionella moravica]STX63570.1 Uncharacterised protein [Legionella moravica]
MIIYLNGRLSLWSKQFNNRLYEIESERTPALELQYNLIKSISHCSVWLHLIVQSIINDQQFQIHHEEDIQNIKNRLKELKQVSHERIAPESEVIHRIILYSDHLMNAKSLTEIQLIHVQYLKEMESINETYAGSATRLQLSGIHQTIDQWISRYKIQLDSSRVLIVSSHGPREDLIEKQYFLDLYQRHGFENAEKGSSHIICVEMLPEQIATVSKESLIDFLRKHQINMMIGQNMLGDPQAMNKDVLGQYAPEVLKTLCPYSRKGSDSAGMSASSFAQPKVLSQSADAASDSSQLRNK